MQRTPPTPPLRTRFAALRIRQHYIQNFRLFEKPFRIWTRGLDRSTGTAGRKTSRQARWFNTRHLPCVFISAVDSRFDLVGLRNSDRLSSGAAAYR